MTALRGRVVRGLRLGRRIGFPTANISYHRSPPPPRGVWRVRVQGTTIGDRMAVCNVGTRPTIGGIGLVVEVHIPGFSGDLYGRTLRVNFLSRIRAERKFPSIEALRAQIRKDVASVVAR